VVGAGLIGGFLVVGDLNIAAKFWLQPEIRLAKNYHYSRKQLRDIAAIIGEHEVELIRAWQKHFGR
jgi:hypothetical protein